MADLTKIFSGMESGPEAIQSNFEKMNQTVENMGGQLSGLHWSELNDAGIVSSNDWQALGVNRGSGYRTANLGGLKLVWLTLLVEHTNGNFKGSQCGYIITLPENIHPAVYGLGGKLDDSQTSWYYWDGNHQISFNATTSDYTWANGHIYPVVALYLANN